MIPLLAKPHMHQEFCTLVLSLINLLSKCVLYCMLSFTFYAFVVYRFHNNNNNNNGPAGHTTKKIDIDAENKINNKLEESFET